MTSSCCSASVASKDIVDIVNSAYSARAREGVEASYANRVAEAFGYTKEQLNAVPEGAHMGLSCGNPVATATIKEGETVVDLGSGGGIDILLAANKVGPNGQAIGLDMSSDMIALARKNAAKNGLRPPHTAFVQAKLTEALPINSNSVDCILSNCVVNLLPFDGKAFLLKEVFRILKDGGRIVLDDIIAKKQLPDNIKNDLASYVGCISGAITENEYKTLLADAGFSNVLLVNNKSDLNIYFQGDSNSDGNQTTPGCCTPAPPNMQVSKPDYDINEWVAAYQIYAIKVAGASEANATETTPPQATLLRWWDAFPTVKSSPAQITHEEVADLILKSDGSSKVDESDFAVIDIRRDDHKGGHVRGSYNHPAQTFCNNLPEFFEKFKGTKRVIFYCQSSNGRGPRCAGWYQDYLDSQPEGTHTSRAYVLTGGIKNWLLMYGGREELVDKA